MKRVKQRIKSEPVISLINIVFLILIFFMVAGTLAQPPKELQFVQTSNLECCSDPDALAITKDGGFLYRGAPLPDATAYLALRGSESTVRLLPDAQLPATDLLRLVAALKRGGIKNIVVLTQAQPQ
ncbi:MAG: biopolymer transporter ExbD [Pseudomonadota bacterium]